MRSLQSAAPGRPTETIGWWLRVVSLSGFVDAERHAQVAGKLAAQLAHTRRWRDESIGYFHSRNGLPLPVDATAETPRRNP